MRNIGIKLKLILLFIVIKVIPVLLISYLAIQGATSLNQYFDENTKQIFKDNKSILETTTSNAINDSIKALDNKSQQSLEKLSVSIATQIADFLYERDKDILFLSRVKLNQKVINSFYHIKKRGIIIHEPYVYDDQNKQWIDSTPVTKTTKTTKRDLQTATLNDNKKAFNYVDPIVFKMKNIPIYKEVVFFNLKGKEIYKKSSIEAGKINVSKKKNTYCKAESYWSKIKNLKEGEIYVSDVIGAYVPSKIIGNFTKEKASKIGIEFKPENHGYAGVENPNGKKFEGIIRFVTPVFRKFKKVGYLSLALDHRHIMEFTDTLNPIDPNIKQNIANAGAGNYAFMWDYEGKNISHPRDYFIVGYNPKTGQRVPGWLSKKVADDFKTSQEKNLNKFLKSYPKFDNQNLKQKANLTQLTESGEIGLDCRYLNFAPQCQGWMQLTQNGGYGSFVIFWSKVWKLTTAATIPYYTGQYNKTQRGFGFVTIGANVDEFHKAANATKKSIDSVIKKQTEVMEKSIKNSTNETSEYLTSLIHKFRLITVIMILIVIIIAIWISNYLTRKIKNLIHGTQEFSKNHLDYQIEVVSDDEIGELEQSFNDMATKIKNEIKKNQEKELILIQRSKMADMGNMISAIIHQWKQPLNLISTISSSEQLNLEMKQSSRENVYVAFDKITNQIQLMSQTMDDFKNFFKQTNKINYNLVEIINNTIRMLSGIYKSKNITINFIKINDVRVDGYPNELMQVLINILNNAKDAILETKCENKIINIEVTSNKEYGMIIITDYAGGIPEDIIDKIFQPYFTTKKEENGTGIGLDMSMNIIKKVNGELSVENIISTLNNKDYNCAQFTIKLNKKG